MGKKKGNAVNNDNVAAINIGGLEFTMEASLGAGIIYENEFRGKAEAPYTGNLYEDMLQLYRECEVEETYYGFSTQLFGIAWAMGRAAGSLEMTYDEFIDTIEHSSASLFELSELYGVVLHQLGDRSIFRLPKGLRDALEPDEEQKREEAESDSGKRDMA